MSLTGSATAAGIVLFSATTGIAAVASVMLGVFVLAMLFLTAAPLFSSDFTSREEAAAASTARAEPSDD